MLVLNVVTLQTFLPSGHKFDHLDDLQTADNRVGAGNGRDNVACHVLHLVERLLLD